MTNFTYKNELSHYGIQGQQWGIRRYQNEDGTLTPEGKAHYGYGSAKEYSKALNKLDSSMNQMRVSRRKAANARNRTARQMSIARSKADADPYNESKERKYQKLASEFNRRKSEVDKIDEQLKTGQTAAERIAKQAEKDGYTVDSKEVYKYTATGKDWVTSAAGTILATGLAVALGSPYTMVSVPGTVVKGNRYSVKDPSNKDKKQ